MEYFGWIVVEKNGNGIRDSFYIEYHVEGKLVREFKGYSPTKAIEFWDKKLGQPVKLLPTPLGAYRVFIEGKKN